jgi:hypothetical protein
MLVFANVSPRVMLSAKKIIDKTAHNDRVFTAWNIESCKYKIPTVDQFK